MVRNGYRQMSDTPSRLFRYEDGSWDYEEPTKWGGIPRFKAHPPKLTVYPVIGETSCGYWIKDRGHTKGKRWVGRYSNHPWAWKTQALALHSYKIRKSHEVFYSRMKMTKALYYKEWAEKQEANDGQ